jgi:hypothetical protein
MNKLYTMLGFQDGPWYAFPALFSEKEIKRQIFHGGRLACRVAYIRYMDKNNKLHSGITRAKAGYLARRKEMDLPEEGTVEQPRYVLNQSTFWLTSKTAIL